MADKPIVDHPVWGKPRRADVQKILELGRQADERQRIWEEGVAKRKAEKAAAQAQEAANTKVVE